jgi:tetratricopeptide (TPR) repeat protein
VTKQGIHEVPRGNRRLDSWKEIASYFDRDERTVKRWEKEKGFPVHRFRESSGARVFAFTDELTQWMNSPASMEEPRLEQEHGSRPVAPVEAIAPRRVRPWKVQVLAAASILAALVGVGLLHAYRRRSSQPVLASEAAASPTSANASASAPGSVRVAGVDPAARDLYLQGRYHWDKRTPADLNRAVGYFNQAVARDPNYAPAYVGLANCYILLREFAAMPSEEAFPQALLAARKAVELDDSSAEAHNALAMVTFYWNWEAKEAEQEFRRAIELDPSYVTAHHWYATFLMVLGGLPEALEQINRAQQLDPASTPILADKAHMLAINGDREQAISLLKQVAASQPAFFSTHQYLSYIYLDDQDYPKYLDEARKAAALSGDVHQMAIVSAAEKGYRSGGQQEMLQNILRVQKAYFEGGSMPAFAVAESYGRLGNKTEALRYLRTSFQRHEVALASIRISVPLALLHDDPAFRQLVVQAGLPPLS